MRSGFRNAELEVAPGGERSARATTCVDIGGTTKSMAVLPAARASAGGLAALVIVAASAGSVSQPYAGIADSTDVVPSTAIDAALP